MPIYYIETLFRDSDLEESALKSSLAEADILLILVKVTCQTKLAKISDENTNNQSCW